MRKITFLLSLCLLVVSCSSDDRTKIMDGYGSIKLNPTLDVIMEEMSRATDTNYRNYTIILDGPAGESRMAYPSDNIIPELEPGEYTVTVTSHPDGFAVPAFDEQVYTGSKTVQVEAGEPTPVTIICKQANAGVVFVYDPTLEDIGLAGIIPTVTQDAGALVYEGENRLQRGYFLPTQAVVTFESQGEALVGADRTLDLQPESLLQITLRKTGNGSMELDVAVEVVTSPTGHLDWTLDNPQGGESLIDALVGEWSAQEDIIFIPIIGMQPNPHNVTITKVDNETIKISNVFNLPAWPSVLNPDGTDEIIAIVNEDDKTLIIPTPQVMESGWMPEEMSIPGLDIHIVPHAKDEDGDANYNEKFDPIPVIEIDGKLTIEIKTGLSYPNNPDEDEHTEWFPAGFNATIVMNDTPINFIIFTLNHKWVKIE